MARKQQGNQTILSGESGSTEAESGVPQPLMLASLALSGRSVWRQ